jgi:hypothetical protein
MTSPPETVETPAKEGTEEKKYEVSEAVSICQVLWYNRWESTYNRPNANGAK